MSSTALIQTMMVNHNIGLAPFDDSPRLAVDDEYFGWRRELSLLLSCYDLKKYIDTQAMTDNAAIQHVNHEEHKPVRPASLLEGLSPAEVRRTGLLQAQMLANVSFIKEMDAWLAIEKVRSDEAIGMAAAKSLMSQMITPAYRASIENFDTLHAHEIIELLDERCQLERKASEALPKLNAMKFVTADYISDYIVAGHEYYLLAKRHDVSLDQVVLYQALIAGLPAAFDKHVKAGGSETVSLSLDRFIRRMLEWEYSVRSELGLDPAERSEATGLPEDD